MGMCVNVQESRTLETRVPYLEVYLEELVDEREGAPPLGKLYLCATAGERNEVAIAPDCAARQYYLTHLSLTQTLKHAMMWSAAFSSISPGFKDTPTNAPDVN
jgi:hypothetical protein